MLSRSLSVEEQVKLATIVMSFFPRGRPKRLVVDFRDRNAFSGSHNNDNAFLLIGVTRWPFPTENDDTSKSHCP